MTQETIIDVTGLCKSFNGQPVVNHVALNVKRGEVFGFLGPNGSGKTTTIRMLCGLLTPDAGQGTCLGYNILTESTKIKQHVGYMTQKYSFYEDMSVEENLNFIATVYHVENRQSHIEQVIQQMNLTKYRHQLTGKLSGGWKQRVALAACLLHEPALLLLDEPTAGIDPIARREFWDTIYRLSEQGITTLMSTHYMDEAERCTRLAYLAYGDLLLTGSVNDVIAATKLKTWAVWGAVQAEQLNDIKKLPGVTQAALFGRQIHVCGFDTVVIEKGLQALAQRYALKWQVIDSTLEDVFIHLVEKSHGEF